MNLYYKVHDILFLRVQMIINRNRCRQWFGAAQTPSHYLSQYWSNSMAHIYVAGVHWVDYFNVQGKHNYKMRRKTVVLRARGLPSPHSWKWAIPTPRVGSGRGTGWPYLVKSPNSKVHEANMGPIWGRQDPGGPHVGPMNFAIWGRFFANHSNTVAFFLGRNYKNRKMDFTKQLVIKWILAPAIKLYIRITNILKNIYIYIFFTMSRLILGRA